MPELPEVETTRRGIEPHVCEPGESVCPAGYSLAGFLINNIPGGGKEIEVVSRGLSIVTLLLTRGSSNANCL
jgi:hypothetical protein